MKKRVRNGADAPSPPSGKRVHVDRSDNVILLDIEGTTTPITFVANVLFPYATDHVESYLRDTWSTDLTRRDVAALVSELHADGSCPQELQGELHPDAAIPMLVMKIKEQITADVKRTPLKQLQGHMWAKGYEGGQLRGAMFEDVGPCLESWVRRGYRVYIYSSGSVEAQKLIFRYSERGDLLPFISGHFDTTVGAKTESSSYRTISQRIEVPPSSIVFITDKLEEATPASEAGLGVLLSVRPGNVQLPQHSFKKIRSFVDARL